MAESISRLRPWAERRRAPLMASIALATLALCFIPLWTTVTASHLHHGGGWFIPGDLWGTQLAASAVAHGHIGQVYSSSTGLVTFPAVAVLLAPGIEVARAVGWTISAPSVAPVHWPTGWLLVMATVVASSLPVLFAADTLAESIGTTRRVRLLLAALQAVAVWNVVLWWGHPEDALGVAFLLWATKASFEGRWQRVGWLCGIAIAFQPLVLLALPALAALVPVRHRMGSALRAVVPSAVLLVGPLITSWHASVHALVSQPNYPAIDHATPWTSISPTLAGHQVAAGPLRLVGLVVVLVGSWFWARKVTAQPALIWIMAVALSSRLIFEPVMVAYYVWPALCLGLVAAARRSWSHLLLCGVVSTAATVFGDAKWQGNWSWWAVETTAVAAFLWSAWPGTQRAVECVTMIESTEPVA